MRENNTNYILHAKIKEKYRSMNIIFATVKSCDLNKKLAILVTKVELKTKQDKTIKLQTCDLNYFFDKAFIWSWWFSENVCLFNQDFIKQS